MDEKKNKYYAVSPPKCRNAEKHKYTYTTTLLMSNESEFGAFILIDVEILAALCLHAACSRS